ncbi:MAG: hypothetical protein H6851_01915 [Geminicoccaceae bacterium]|nr:hypothetical protein [Geminicoccaceae bacterium]
MIAMFQNAKILYLAHDSNDSRVLHRARALRTSGVDLIVAAFHRTKIPGRTGNEWASIDLGRTVDYAYFDRVVRLFLGAVRLWHMRSRIRSIDAVIARNIEQLLLALWVRQLSHGPLPIAYECLDIHRMMLGTGVTSRIFRLVERFCLTRTELLIVSSPSYIEEYFASRQHFRGRWLLVENKLPAEFTAIPRSSGAAVQPGRPTTIGWFGMLRCMKSFDLLLKIADARPDDVRILIRGKPTEVTEDAFRRMIGDRPNVEYGGVYRNPDDLAELYSAIDLTWAIDFYQEGDCSEWLLPNRLYESCFFTVPLLARAGTTTAAYTLERKIGWVLVPPLAEHLLVLLDELRGPAYRTVVTHIAAMPVHNWVDNGEASDIVGGLIEPPRS